MSRELDLALQAHAAIGTTPADRFAQRALRTHMLGQFLPWVCTGDELDTLCEMLAEVQLVFNVIGEGEETGVASTAVEGAICSPIFAPALGLIPQARGWRELETGSVKHRLESAALIARLPGREGGAELAAAVEGMLAGLAEEAPAQWLADETHVRSGLPVDLSDRLITIQRIHEGSINVEAVEEAIAAATALLRSVAATDGAIEVHAPLNHPYGPQIAVISASWQPKMTDSTARSVSAIQFELAHIFDSLLPRERTASAQITTTIDALRLLGEIYFEGDRLF